MANIFWKNLLVLIGSKLAKKTVKEILKEELPAKENPPQAKPAEAKIHPWRLCSVVRHWVKTHPMNVPDGKTTRHGHCADNPPKRKKELMRDYLSKNEIEEIAAEHFDSLTGPPTAGVLLKDFADSDKYDVLIRGWVKYWNDIFKPNNQLDANLIKALMASASGFRVNPPSQNAGKAGKANGILQITDQMIKELSNPSGGLKDHYIEFDQTSAFDPNMSICAAVRWLFDKQKIATRKLKREASWMDAIFVYKGYMNEMIAYTKKKNKELLCPTRWQMKYLGLFFLLINLSAWARDEIAREIKKVAGYSVVITRYPDAKIEVKVSKGRTTYFSDQDYGGEFYLGLVRNEEMKEAREKVWHGAPITGTGRPTLVLSQWTGGAHCCYLSHVFELSPKFRKISTIQGGNYPVTFEDINHDGHLYVNVVDDFLAYVFTSFSQTALATVILEYNGETYHVASRLMKKPIPTDADLYFLSKKIKQELGQTKNNQTPYSQTLLENMVNLLYAGHEREAFDLVQKNWPPNHKRDKGVFLKEFRRALARSLYYKDFKAHL